MRHNSTLQFRIQLVVIIILSMCDLNNILKNCGEQRGAVSKLFNKLRLQRSLRTKNTGAAQLADIICVSATSLASSYLPKKANVANMQTRESNRLIFPVRFGFNSDFKFWFSSG